MTPMRNGIPTRVLGSTGVEVTVLGIGGYHIGNGTAELGVRLIRTAVDEGINFLDNAWCYHEGTSERIMGEALQDGYRDRVFLMTKNHGRDAATFRSQLEQSLLRLRTDHIDLLQFHKIIHEGTPEQIRSGGALDEALKARDQGKIRFIGFTGHRWPHLLLDMLSLDFCWDTVQMPVNLLDAHMRSFAVKLLPQLHERGIGVIGMKSLAGGRLLETGVSPVEAMRYTLSQPIHALITGVDSVDVLSQNLDMARAWRPMSSEEQEELLAHVRPMAADGHLEPYKTA